jgi:glutamine cyclotransferase
MKDRIDMKKLFYIALSLALLTNCMPTGSAKLEDVLFEMTYNEVGIGQGGFIKDGKVYFSAGSPPFHCKLHVYDLKTKEEVLCQELLPLQYEPEGIEIVGDKLYTVFWCAGGVTKIYEFALHK